MSSLPKSGALTIADLKAIWKAACDPGYAQALEQAGEGRGFEVYTQSFEQLARVSTAINRTTQSMYIAPFSGQTGEPASGGREATVTLTFTRTKRIEWPIRLRAGDVFVLHVETDYETGEQTGVEFESGRRYVLAEDCYFAPGEAGPQTVLARAHKEGVGYENPLPRTLRRIEQFAKGFENVQATVTVVSPNGLLVPNMASATVRAINVPDTFVPSHVGQFVTFTQGANVGRFGRIAAFLPPDLLAIPPLGSAVVLELLHVVDATTFAGDFLAGEEIAFDNGGPAFAWATFYETLDVSGVRTLSYFVGRGDFSLIATATNVTGVASGATLTIRAMVYNEFFTAEVSTASWQILDYEADLGITVFNELSPTGGRSAMLDELGDERALNRSPGETDAEYRARIREVPDVVSPNAIRRALNRLLGATPYCFREVGSELLPGFFYDGDRSAPSATPHGAQNDAYDTQALLLDGTVLVGGFVNQDPAVIETPDQLVCVQGYMGELRNAGTRVVFIPENGHLPDSVVGLRVRTASGAIFMITGVTATPYGDARKFHRYFNYAQFRGFFLVGVRPTAGGEFGIAYDVGAHSAYDAAPFLAFYDGFPTLDGIVNGRIVRALDTARAAGVGYALYPMGDEPCT